MEARFSPTANGKQIVLNSFIVSGTSSSELRMWWSTSKVDADRVYREARGCGQIILTKEVWRQKERKQESVRRFCQSTWQVEDSLSNVGKNVQPRFAFCIVFGLFSIEPYRSFCKEYKVCRLCFLSSAKIFESNKPRLNCPLLENLFKDAFYICKCCSNYRTQSARTIRV